MPKEDELLFYHHFSNFKDRKMPPKKGNKKGVHKVPEEDWRVTRRKEQEKKAAEKRSKREIKKIMRKRKKNKMDAPSDSENSNNQEFLQDETRDTKNVVKQDIDPPRSSCTEPSTSCTSIHQEHQKNFSSKVKKNIDSSHSFVKQPIESNFESTSSTTGQQKNQKSFSGKGKKDTNLPSKLSNKPSTSSTMRQQINQSGRKTGKKDTNLPNKTYKKPNAASTIGQKVIQKTGTISAPPGEKSVSKQKSFNLKIPKNITEGKKSDDNITAAGVDNPSNDSVDKKLPKSDRDKMLKDENKEVGKVSTESKDLVSTSSNIVTPAIHSKSSVNLTDKRNILEPKLKATEAEMKSLDEQEKLSSSVEKEEMVVIGDIKLRSKEQSIKISDKKLTQIAIYDPFNRIVFVGDKNIEISIQVNEGSQVICNVKNLQETDLLQNVASGSDTVEGHASANSDAKSKTENLEEYDKTMRDTKCDSETVGEFSNAYYQTVDDQAAGNSGTDTLTDSEVTNETATETKGISRQEKIEKICSDYLKNVDSLLETFDRKFKNYLKDKKVKQT